MRNLHTPHNDDRDMTDHPSTWTDRQVDSLLTGHGEPADADLLAVIAGIKHFTTAAPPVPSPALQALFDSTAALPLATALTAGRVPRRRRHRTQLRACILTLTASTGLLTAGAAANALPQDAQRTAARVLNTLTPFRFPTPPPAHRLPNSPAAPQPAVSPSAHASTHPVRDHRGADQGDHTGGSPSSRTASPIPEENSTDTTGEGTTTGTDVTGTSGSTTRGDIPSGNGGENPSAPSQPDTGTARGQGSETGWSGSPTPSQPTTTPNEGEQPQTTTG